MRPITDPHASTPRVLVILGASRKVAFGEFMNGERRESVIIVVSVEHETPSLSSVDFRGRLGGRLGRQHT